jgi:hypothetical protein
MLPSPSSNVEDKVGEPTADPVGGTDTKPAAKRAWLGRLSTYLASFAGGAAVNDLSTTLGYHGLAGAIALLAVVAAATSIRGLDPRARLPRRALWLFLAPAACMAIAAAFSSGAAASILTAAAAILTIGAVLMARELQSAERLLAGAALIVSGAAVIAGCTASIAVGNTGLGVSLIPSAAMFLAAGVAYIAGRDALAGTAVIAAGAMLITAGTALIATKTAVDAIGNASGLVLIFMSGLLLILEGPTLILSGRIEGMPTGRTAVDRLRPRISPVIAATLALLVAVVASGPLISTKGHTPAGAEHVAEARTLTLVAFIAIFATYGAGLVVAIGPRNLTNRARQVIDWAIKVPQATQEPLARTGPGNETE